MLAGARLAEGAAANHLVGGLRAGTESRAESGGLLEMNCFMRRTSLE